MKKTDEKGKPISVENVLGIGPVDYADGDIVFIDDIRDMAHIISKKKTIRLDMVLFLVCRRGRLQVRLKNRTYTLLPNDVICCGPETVVNDSLVSPDFEAKILCIAPRVIQNLVHMNKEIWNSYFFVRQNPVAHIDEYGQQMYGLYYNLLQQRIKIVDHLYKKEAMSSLVSAILYDLIGMLISQNEQLRGDGEPVKQRDVIYRRFMELLTSTHPRKRSVNYYAESLCITPKYLSSIVKRESGKTAYDWITQSVVEDIKQQLLYTDHSIKEIVVHLDFPNMSFFGKYVKEHLGMSPTEYRRRKK